MAQSDLNEDAAEDEPKTSCKFTQKHDGFELPQPWLAQTSQLRGC